MYKDEVNFSIFQEQTPKTATNYEFAPLAASLHPNPIYSLAATRNGKWVFTGSADGEIRKFDVVASMNGKTSLTIAQRSSLPDGTKGVRFFSGDS
jgi:hypothetical protein